MIHLDVKHFLNQLNRYVETIVKPLDINETFYITVDNYKYTIRYEVLNGVTNLYVTKPEIGEEELVKPKLTLSLGTNLLPNSKHDYKEYKPKYNTILLGTHDISDEVIKLIKEKVKTIGLSNLIKK